MAGPKIRKARWFWQSLVGSESEAIAAEYDVGRDLAAELARQVPIRTDGEHAALIRQVGSRLAACVANKQRKFAFAVMETAEPNAFALPGGFIYLTRGLIDLCRADPDELAFVIGHEMAHVIRGHAIDRIAGEAAVQALSRTAVVRGAIGGWLKRVGVQALQSAYSQDCEFEADALGAKLVRAARLDITAPERLLRRLRELDREGRLSEVTKYFSSHPPLAERANAVAVAPS
jgi:Zn-dependent protease with chaperone function